MPLSVIRAGSAAGLAIRMAGPPACSAAAVPSRVWQARVTCPPFLHIGRRRGSTCLLSIGRSASKMDLRTSWRWAFKMVEIDRMARVRHNGAESGHQLPLEHARRWCSRTSIVDTLECLSTSVDVRIDPAATMHARAASMRMPCSSLKQQLHACMVARPSRADTDTA
jgi:hypothetical protein